MELLAEISDKSLGLSDFEVLGKKFELRKSARAILINADGKIAIQYLARDHFHKLPGGGVDGGELIEAALLREVAEEVGCTGDIEQPLGVVIEYREEHALLHISYCYVVHVRGEVGMPKLEQAEIDEGMSTIWMTPEEAIEKMETDEPITYQGKFILQRELAFLKKFLHSKN